MVYTIGSKIKNIHNSEIIDDLEIISNESKISE